MPRQARIDAPGGLHHIVVRGIERRAIFEDEKDREDFLERLSGLIQETATPCYAWALMTNHVRSDRHGYASAPDWLCGEVQQKAWALRASLSEPVQIDPL